jgi:hypothetical protein
VLGRRKGESDDRAGGSTDSACCLVGVGRQADPKSQGNPRQGVGRMGVDERLFIHVEHVVGDVVIGGGYCGTLDLDEGRGGEEGTVESVEKGGVGRGDLSTVAIEDAALFRQRRGSVDKGIDVGFDPFLSRRHFMLVPDAVQGRRKAGIAMVQAELQAGRGLQLRFSKVRMSGDVMAGTHVGNECEAVTLFRTIVLDVETLNLLGLSSQKGPG